MLGNVLLLSFLIFFVFGIISVQLWQGKLRNRCFTNFTKDSAFFTRYFYVRCFGVWTIFASNGRIRFSNAMLKSVHSQHLKSKWTLKWIRKQRSGEAGIRLRRGRKVVPLLHVLPTGLYIPPLWSQKRVIFCIVVAEDSFDWKAYFN